MTASIVLRPDAEAELAEAHAWYEAQSAGLGAELLDAVELALQRIAESPKAHPVVHRQLRAGCGRRRATSAAA
jgi:hypothetical protein